LVGGRGDGQGVNLVAEGAGTIETHDAVEKRPDHRQKQEYKDPCDLVVVVLIPQAIDEHGYPEDKQP
jgi:hypothetical protein